MNMDALFIIVIIALALIDILFLTWLRSLDAQIRTLHEAYSHMCDLHEIQSKAIQGLSTITKEELDSSRRLYRLILKATRSSGESHDADDCK